MKIRTILASCLAMLMLASCSKEGNDVPVDPVDVAYVSINILKQTGTRAGSTEDDGASESDLNTLCLVTFNDSENVIGIPGTTNYYNLVKASNLTEPAPVKIAGAATKLLVIANPGTQLLNVLGSINASSTFADINAAIKNIGITELTDNTNGFAMIGSGEEKQTPASGDLIATPLIDITSYVEKTVDHNYDEDAAIAAAKLNRVTVQIERIASKLLLKTGITIAVTPSTGSFDFGNWTLDGLNTTFYPFAKKTLLTAMQSPSTYYKFNFYTEDPNFNDATGLEFTTVNSTTYEPELVMGWMNDGALTYCVENTMAAAEQKFGNTTRMVIKATYYPDASWTDDWFHFAGVDYKDLDELQAAYGVAGGTNLQAACDKMFDKIFAYATANGLTVIGTNFATLDPSDLDQLSPYGGEIIKDGSNDVIRWYQGGLNYYYYQIQHNDELTAEMAFGKYGVVRNNWYSMTLTSVAGAGTPWYPDINNPGPGDPDPTDPIDESVGYLGVEIDVAPWIFWEREIGI